MATHDINDWNRIAATYVQGVGTPADRIYQQFEAVLWEALGNVHGRRILDVGCGSGWLSQLLVQAGATVTGVDGSTALLTMARTALPDTRFLEHDLTHGLPKLDSLFDLVVAHMVVMDLPDIAPLFAAIRSILAPRGTFIFTIQHPCFFRCKAQRDPTTNELYRMVKGYLQPEVWRIESFGGHNHYHRSLTEYADQLRTNCFAIARLYEPPHIPATETNENDHAFWSSIPVFLLIEAIPV